MRSLMFGFVCLAASATANGVWADGVVLVNGDILHGDVVSLDAESLKFQSRTFGELDLPRSDVASVHLGEVQLPAVQPHPAGPPSAAPDLRPNSATPPRLGQAAPRTPEELIGQLTGRGASPSDAPAAADTSGVLEQLQSGGLNARTLSEVQKALPLVNTPEVRDYFNSTVDGLMSGNLSIQDVRKDAVKARDAILDLKKDLGPGADALNGYLSILNGFIEETTPAEPPAAAAAPSAPDRD